MKLPDPLYTLFNVRQGEELPTVLMFFHSCLLGVAASSFFTAASALFLSEYGVERLPYAYIASAVVGSVLGYIYSRLDRYLSFSDLLAVNIGFLFFSIALFRIGFWLLDETRWLNFFVFVWITPVLAFIFIEFWGLAGRLFDLRQAKRLYGFIGSGEVVTGIISFFAISAIVGRIGTVNLLIISACGFAACLAILFYITHRFSDRLSFSTSMDSSDRKHSGRFLDLLKNRYLIHIVLVMVMATFGLYFIDYAFLNQAHAHYPQKDKLAEFFGMLYGSAKIIELIVKSVVSGRLVNRFGIKAGLSMLPVMIAATVLAGVIMGSFMGVETSLFFWCIILTKLFDRVGRRSVYEPSFRILYQPLKAEQRMAFQTKTEGILEPLVTGVAGGLLLIFSLIPGFGPLVFSWLLFFVLAVWVAVAILASHEYTRALAQALQKRLLIGEGTDFSLKDDAIISVLKKKLTSINPGEVIYSLNMLEKAHPENMEPTLIDMLDHPSPQVRQDVLKRMEKLNTITALEAIRKKVVSDESPQVWAAALRAMCAIGEADLAAMVSEYLEDSDAEVRMGAMVGLLRSGGIDGVLAAGDDLITLVISPDPMNREFAAKVLGEVGVKNFYRPLLTLLDDQDLDVRRAALTAAGKIGNPKLIAPVMKNLGIYAVRSAAVSALVAMDETVLVQLEAAFHHRKSNNILRARIARILGQIRGDRAIALLRDKIDYPDEEVRYHVLVSLNLCGYRAGKADLHTITEKIKMEVADAVWALSVIYDLGLKKTTLLKSALLNEVKQNQKRIFLLLSFIYDSKSILRARDILAYGSSEKRAYALEIIDIAISKRIKAMVFPLLEDLTPSQKLKKLAEQFPQPQLGRTQRLRQIVTMPEDSVTPLTKIYTLYLVGELSYSLYLVGKMSFSALTADIIDNLSADNAVIRETALWALSQLDKEAFRIQARKLRSDPDKQVQRIAANSDEDKRGVGTMLLTIEKVIILKSVEIFSHIPEDILIEVASIMEEVEFDKGQVIIEKGEIGQCMYLIAEGNVHVHDGDQSIAYLGEKEIVGEMSLLDSEPRSASVTAEQDSLLLRLDQETFYELMADRVEVARGIIKVLTRRIRSSTTAKKG
jgi:AAA family ATP:ADP antiporter